MNTQSLDWSLPYASHRSAVMGRNVVSTSQPLAAQAGLRMLLAGGNAVDAAIAAAMALTVVEPTGCGLGSDGFAIVWDGKELHGLNASGRSPAAWTPEYFAKLGGIPETGWNAVTVPGAVSAWVALSKRLGKLPFSQLAQPAIDYARNGFPVSPTIAKLWALGAAKLGAQPGFSECFMPDYLGGRVPQAGEIFRSEAHARTLELIAETEGEAFYRGVIAERIAAHSQANGGSMTMAESGLPGYSSVTWFGVYLPANAPPALVQRIHAAFAKAVQSPEVAASLAKLGVEPAAPSTSAQFGAMVQTDSNRWATVIRQHKITVE